MNNEMTRDVKRYKRQIKANLLCGTKLSKRFMQDLSGSIDNYITENDLTQFNEVKEHFGEPEQIAQSFLAATDIRVIRKKVKLRQIILLALIAALLIWGVGVAMSSKKSYDLRGGYGIECPIVIISDTEADAY